jgi:glucosyl-3-phosphoglycerate synthase
VASSVTFAVVGRDEEATLARALEQALAAARPGDSVWFVDSASSDGSAALARSLGVEVVAAPAGKGRAVAVALGWLGTEWLCLLDADLQWSERNLAAALRDAALGGDADMVVGELSFPRRSSVGPALYRPLVGALFGEVLPLRKPLSGYRVLRAGLAVGDLPAGYGVEAHLNVAVALSGARTAAVELGGYRGPLRGYRNIPVAAADVAAALLDLAVAHGRIRPGARPAWEAWVEEVLAVIRDQPGEGADDAAYLRHLERAGARPLPAA